MDNNPIGYIGIESPNADVCYLERLSVLPAMRGNLFGIALAQYALECAGTKEAGRVSTAIITEQTELKEWYKKLGFIEMQIKSFSQLPFKVCLMEFEIAKSANHVLPSEGNFGTLYSRW